MDRLSELPDALIFNIFSLLPMRDVVRTTVLSRRWKSLWTATPCLNFHDEEYNNRFRRFINGAIKSWRGIKIQKFKINFLRDGDELEIVHFTSDINSWVSFAIKHNVEELYLHQQDYQFEVDHVPQCVYSCSSLKKISLHPCSSLKKFSLIGSFDIEVNGKDGNNAQWNQLKSLRIDCSFITDDAINQVLRGSPKLEVLDLVHVDRHENFSIRSSSLKKLSIGKYLRHNHNEGPPTIAELRIWTPNLETLELSGKVYEKCLLMDVSSLAHAILGFYDYDVICGTNFQLQTLKQILPRIHHVERLTLSEPCIKELIAMKEQRLVSPFPNVKFLQLNEPCYGEYDVVDLLEIFPKMEMIVLQSTVNCWCDHADIFFEKSERNRPNSFLQELRTVEVTRTNDRCSIFPFIEILLKYASKLEKMVFRERRASWNSSCLESEKKLLRAPRSSPTAELIFCEYSSQMKSRIPLFPIPFGVPI